MFGLACGQEVFMKILYKNGNVITMNGRPAEAVLTEDGMISAVGEAEGMDAAGARQIDLEGQTLMPAFIDAHSHFSAVANGFLQVDLENCGSFQEIEEKIRDYVSRRNPEPGGWILARGYDP